MSPYIQETFRKNKTDQWWPRVWHREQACLQGSTRGLFREKGLFRISILVVAVTYIILSKCLRQAEELPCRKLRGSRAAVRLKARRRETRRDRRQSRTASDGETKARPMQSSWSLQKHTVFIRKVNALSSSVMELK